MQTSRYSFWRRLFPAANIFSVIDRGNLDQCREFLRSDPTALRQTDELGRTPLHVAADKGRKEIVELLLSAGADLRARDAEDATPLHWAAVGGNSEVIEALVSAGADVNAVDKHALTPAQVAEMRGHPLVAGLLRRHGSRR